MTGICAQRVVAITGAGNGIGRGYALAFAAAGARVVVNDVGGVTTPGGERRGAAELVVEQIKAGGGDAVVHTDDISTWDGGESLIASAVQSFGALDVLVNNAGVLRDRPLATMSEAEWDTVLAVHLKGTFATMRHAAAYWRERAKSGETADARVINTSSPSGLFGNPGQTNYGAAKAGIASLTIIAAMELARYGVTVNAIAPTARTQLTERFMSQPPESGFDAYAPENIAPLVVWLGSAASSAVTGRVFGVVGGRITVLDGWVNGPSVDQHARWAPEQLTDVIPDLVAQAPPGADMNGERKAAVAL